jgi:nucleoside-diphosphate-sugar epimerase
LLDTFSPVLDENEAESWHDFVACQNLWNVLGVEVKRILVTGAGGFIGAHLVKKLKREKHWVRGVDLKYPPYSFTPADDFVVGDLRRQDTVRNVFDGGFDEVYQLAADMGGAGFVFTGKNDADIMCNSALINLNILHVCREKNVGRVFYSSSACIYPKYNQQDPDNMKTSEDSAYPAMPDSEYGWEKLFSERAYLAFHRNYGLDVRIARLHNIFGPECSWNDGREKAPAALCRKIVLAQDGDEVEAWGDGTQTRSFLYVDECLEGVRKLMDSEFIGPVNIGSEEMVSICELAQIIVNISGKELNWKYVPGPTGVRSRNSDNRLVRERLGWAPNYPLRKGLEKTYGWIKEQVEKGKG